MASTKYTLPKQKSLVCALGNQEKCKESYSVFNPDFKVIIKDIASETTKKSWKEKNAYLDDSNYENSMDSYDEEEKNFPSSGRNSLILAGIRNLSTTHRDGEESGVSSGYESEHANQNRHARRKRKLSKRKELLSAAFMESHADVKVHRSSTKCATLAANIHQIEASDLDSTEADSTSSDEESVFSEDSSTDNQERNSESEHQSREENVQPKKSIDDSLPKNIISNFSDGTVAECRDQQSSFSGNYRFCYQNEGFCLERRN